MGGSGLASGSAIRRIWAHLTEGCEDDLPHLIPQVATAAATQQDHHALDALQADLAAHDLLPAHQLVDAGDTSAKRIRHSLDAYAIDLHAIDLIGPVPVDPSWQARTPGAVDVSPFAIDWLREEVTCPGGAAQCLLAAEQRRQGRVHRPNLLCSARLPGLSPPPRLHRCALHWTQPDAALSPTTTRGGTNRPHAPANSCLQDALSSPLGQ